jgi:hypothetical protein
MGGTHTSEPTPDQKTGARHPWRRSLVSLVALSVAATGVVIALTDPGAQAGQASVLARDSFTRNLSNGWGSAPQGGEWTTTGAVLGTFSVSDGTGNIKLVPNGRTPTALLTAVSSTRTDLRLTLRTDVLANGNGMDMFAIGRRIAGRHEYVTAVHVAPGGIVSVQLGRRSASGTLNILRSAAHLPHISYRTGQTLLIRIQVFGTNPTTIRTKVWLSTQGEPAVWALSVTDSSKGFQSRGSIGVGASLGSTVRNGPINLHIDNLLVTSLPIAGKPWSGSVGAQLTGRASAAAGAVAVGRARYPIPLGAIFVSPSGRDTSNGSAAHPLATVARAAAIAKAGGTIVLRAGTYHQSVALPGNKPLTVQSYPGEAVWFDGSSTVSGWVKSGNAWVRSGWTTNFDHSATFTKGAPDGTAANWSFVNAKNPMAAYPDQVWINGVALAQVGSVGQVREGTFYVDNSSKRLIVGSNPSGQTVQASTLTTALTVTSSHTTLRGFGVRRYATSVYMMGTIRVFAPNATLDNLEITDNAAEGVAVDAVNGTLSHITSIRNGLLGIQGNYADGLKASGVYSASNNTQHFNIAPVSGGMKVTRSRNISVLDSRIESNDGPGLWFYESCFNVTVAGNDVISNSADGIRGEISDTMLISGNLISKNGGAGVRLANTGHSQVINNSFSINNRNVNITQDRRRQSDLANAGHDPRQKLPDSSVPWLSGFTTVKSNSFTNSSGNAFLAVEDWTHRYSAAALHIVASNNIYVRSTSAKSNVIIIWSRGPGNPATFATVGQFRAATGQLG